MRVVIAPDSFKESLSAAAVAQAIEAGVRDVLAQADTVCVPMADGGEGSLDAVLAATSGQRRGVQALNANGDPCDASWGWLGDGKAFIEMAAPPGLAEISTHETNTFKASTNGGWH